MNVSTHVSASLVIYISLLLLPFAALVGFVCTSRSPIHQFRFLFLYLIHSFILDVTFYGVDRMEDLFGILKLFNDAYNVYVREALVCITTYQYIAGQPAS